MSYKPFFNENSQAMNPKLVLQRWLYVLVGILTMLPIILFSVGQILHMKRDDHEFAICLLFLIHSGLFV